MSKVSRVIDLNCDVDGILAGWVEYVTTKYYPGLTQEQLNKHENRVGMLTEMYRQEPDLFLNLPVMPGAVELVAFLTRLEREGYQGRSFNVRYLTATDTIHPNFYKAAYDKQQWLERHFDIPSTKVQVVLKSIEKTRYAHQKAVLIDDYDKNVDAFAEHGGEGVLVPENYNPHDVCNRIMDVIDDIIMFK